MVSKIKRTRQGSNQTLRARVRPRLETLEDRNLLANGQWTAWFNGMAAAADFETQTNSGARLLQIAGVSPANVSVLRAQDLSGAFIVQAPLNMSHTTLVSHLQAVPGFTWAQEYTEPDPTEIRKILGKVQRSHDFYGPFDYDTFLSREKNGEFPDQSGPVDPGETTDVLGNNNGGAGTTSLFTQSETDILAYGNHVILGFNDSGSNAGGTNKFTGWSRSTDGGMTFTDGGVLPTNPGGDAGDPVLARNNTTGRIYYATLGFSVGTIQVFKSDDDAATWQAPVVGTPGGATEDKQWMVVDNYAGAGNGNVYLMSRNFGAGAGIFMYRSTDNGATFGPNGGTLIVNGMQGAYVDVGPDHSVYAFWYDGPSASIRMRKSVDQGVTFGAPVTVASGLIGGVNGDLGLTGIRQGTATAAGFRSSEFPHVAINPVSGNIYVTYDNDGPGSDKADVFLTQSTDGGTTWSAPIKVNDDVGTTDQWMPTLAVTPDGSRLGVFYDSRQEDAVGNNLLKHYGRVAAISGTTLNFFPSFAVSDVASLPEFGRDSLVNSVYMGDYNHVVATPGVFHVVWADNRDDLPGGAPRKDPNVYYDKVNLGLAVATTVPAQGSIIATQPTTFTVNMTDPVQPGTVDATDFVVNGIPADSFVIMDADTIDFSFAISPVTTQGLQTMHMDGGAMLRDPDSDPLLVFDGTFRYDLTTLMVTSTNPPFPGGVFTLPPPLTYEVNFNEALDPASVQVGDLLLSGIPGAFVQSVTLINGNTTAQFTLNGLASEGVLTATINGGSVTDVFGNPGNPFTAPYEVDFGTVPYTTPLTVKNPIGGLIYDPVMAGRVNTAVDVDSFTLSIDAGQTITILVSATEATLQPSITLRNPANAIIGTASAGAPNQNALLQTVPTSSATGTYTIEVSGVGGTIGNYSIQVILNAALEREGIVPGGGNNTLATAQSIDPSFISLQTAVASASRGAVMGTTDLLAYSAAAITPTFEDISIGGTVVTGLTNQDDTSVSVNIGFTFPFFGTNNTAVFVSSNGLLSFGSANSSLSNTDMTTAPTQASIAAFWDDLHTNGGSGLSNVFTQVTGAGSNQHLTIQWNQIRFFSGGTAGDTITFQVQLYVDGRIQLNYQDLVSGAALGNNGGSASVGIKAAGTQGVNRLLLAFNNGPNAFVGTGLSTLITPPSPIADYSSFSLNAGQTATVALTALTANPLSFEIRDGSNAVLATGVAGSTNLTRVVNNFVAPSSGTYFLSVSSSVSNVPYTLIVTKNADFDTEPNNSFATAQSIAGTQGVLGGMSADQSYIGSAVTFGFDDISSTGTVITGLTNVDDTAVSIPVGFTFRMYGVDYTSVFVSSNGLLTFGTANTSFTNTDLTTAPAQASIAVFWDDLHTAGGAAGSNVFFQVLGSGATQRLVIQWNQIRFFTGGTAGDTITFQVQLFAADGSVRFNYQDLVSGSAGGNNGASASVGIKDAGNQGPNRVLLAFNNGPNTFVGTNQSTVVAQPPAEDWYSVNITSLTQQLVIDTKTPGDGAGQPAVLLDPDIELYSPSGALLFSGTTRADGRNETIKLRRAAVTGTYRIRVRAENGTSGDYFIGASVITPPGAGPGGSLLPKVDSFLGSSLISAAQGASAKGQEAVGSKSVTHLANSVRDVKAAAPARKADLRSMAEYLGTPAKKNGGADVKIVDSVFTTSLLSRKRRIG